MSKVEVPTIILEAQVQVLEEIEDDNWTFRSWNNNLDFTGMIKDCHLSYKFWHSCQKPFGGMIVPHFRQAICTGEGDG